MLDTVLQDAVRASKAKAEGYYRAGQTTPFWMLQLGAEWRAELAAFFPASATPATIRAMRDRRLAEPTTDFSPGMKGELERITLGVLDGFLADNAVAQPA